jgi:hypothetical protein
VKNGYQRLLLLHVHSSNKELALYCLFLCVTDNKTSSVWRSFFLIGTVGGRSPIGSTRLCGQQWPIVPAPGDYDHGEIGGMIGRGNRSTRRKPAPVSLCPPQTPYAAQKRTRDAAVWSQRLTAWATARPLKILGKPEKQCVAQQINTRPATKWYTLQQNCTGREYLCCFETCVSDNRK